MLYQISELRWDKTHISRKQSTTNITATNAPATVTTRAWKYDCNTIIRINAIGDC